jgi:hypothetical protein
VALLLLFVLVAGGTESEAQPSSGGLQGGAALRANPLASVYTSEQDGAQVVMLDEANGLQSVSMTGLGEASAPAPGKSSRKPVEGKEKMKGNGKGKTSRSPYSSSSIRKDMKKSSKLKDMLDLNAQLSVGYEQKLDAFRAKLAKQKSKTSNEAVMLRMQIRLTELARAKVCRDLLSKDALSKSAGNAKRDYKIIKKKLMPTKVLSKPPKSRRLLTWSDPWSSAYVQELGSDHNQPTADGPLQVGNNAATVELIQQGLRASYSTSAQSYSSSKTYSSSYSSGKVVPKKKKRYVSPKQSCKKFMKMLKNRKKVTLKKLREKESERKSKAKARMATEEKDAQKKIQKAQKKVDAEKKKAKAIKKEALKKVDEEKANAKKAVKDAAASVKNMKRDAEIKAATTKRRANEEAATIGKKAQKDALKKKEKANLDAQSTKAAAKNAADQAVAKANKDAAKTQSKAASAAAKTTDDANKVAGQLKKDAERKAAEKVNRAAGSAKAKSPPPPPPKKL